MSYFDEPFRTIACAARMRDWATIDAVLEDLRVQGRIGVIRGFSDARKRLGLEPPPPALHAPDPVTIHDLPSREGIEIIGAEGDSRRWRKRKAA